MRKILIDATWIAFAIGVVVTACSLFAIKVWPG